MKRNAARQRKREKEERTGEAAAVDVVVVVVVAADEANLLLGLALNSAGRRKRLTLLLATLLSLHRLDALFPRRRCLVSRRADTLLINDHQLALRLSTPASKRM